MREWHPEPERAFNNINFVPSLLLGNNCVCGLLFAFKLKRESKRQPAAYFIDRRNLPVLGDGGAGLEMGDD